MFGEKAMELIKELKRNPDSLPIYNEQVMRQVFEEIKILFEQNQVDFRTLSSLADGQGSSALMPKIITRHEAINRNKRCLLAYVYNRALTLKKLRWDVASVLPADIKVNLSEPEQTFFQNYNRNLAKFMRNLGKSEQWIGGLDLTQDRKPPKSLLIEVRCLQDYGEFGTSDGPTVMLKTGTLHCLPRYDCESLIRQGILEHVS